MPAVPIGTGRVFYVDAAAGNDVNDGLSETRAFRTIGRAVSGSSAPVAPGDTVRIKAGFYREQLRINKSGTASARIAIGAYGNGAVVIDASRAVTGWTLYSGQIYRAKPGFVPTAVVVDGQPLFPEFSAGALIEKRWYYNTATGDLYLWAPGGGNPASHDVGVVTDDQAQEGVFVDSASYVTLYGVTVRFAGGHGVAVIGNSVRVERSRLLFNGKHGLTANPWGSITGTNLAVVKNEVYHNFLRNWPRGRYKWGGWGSGVGSTTPNALYEGNVVHKNGGEGMLSYLAGGGLVVRDNVVYDNWSVNLYVDNEPNAVVENNYVYCHTPDAHDLYNNGDPDPSDNAALKRLRAQGVMTADEDYGVSPAANLHDVTIRNNVIVGCRQGIQHYAAAAGSGLKNVKVLNNTIVVPSAGVPGEPTFSGISIPYNNGNNSGSVYRDNVVYASGAGTYVLNGGESTADPFKGISVDHNLWFNTSNSRPFQWGPSYNSYTHAEWLALAGTAHGAGDIYANPQLTNVTDMTDPNTKEPTSGSPAGGAGMNVGLTYDYNFCARSTTAPTLGAFEGAGGGTSLPVLSINDVTVAEGNSGTTTAAFTVALSQASTNTVTVAYASAPATATAGVDYVGVSGTLTFAPGTTTRTIPITIYGDTAVEGNETFAVNLSAPVNATIAGAQGIGTITNDDTAALPALSINNVTVVEGNSGTRLATFTVTLSPASTRTVTVAYASAQATAAVGVDYIGVNGTLTFAPGTTTRTIPITIYGDTAAEGNETFAVNLSAPVNATIADGQGIGTITNDDAAALPTLSINNVTLAEGNSGTRTATFTVTLSAASTRTVTVAYASAQATATVGVDYVGVNSTLTFAPGTTTRTIPITIYGDTTVEGNETFAVNLSAPVNATIADGQGICTITNDD
jgi:hypothetical protein